ncbi:STAS domain-containing protein [Saccharothrix sp. S26]|uniref:STAS domain-containing protein n=1 Tax=Saccharothrix sp. S26 TaxID=2907215 RepID=UPI001F304357|nr:STAS domain-containing protein [Saccharothrix sp. S26]MCE6995462.1 STAS domain-containing protein [Saccharothrix sp. S26]
MTERTTRPLTTIDVDGGIPLVRVSGSLDAAAQRPVAAELDTVFDTRPGAIVLDLSDVDFMGSAGIALLINTRHRAARLGIPFAVVAGNHRVLRPLRMSQVDTVLPLHPTVPAAVAAVRLAST